MATNMVIKWKGKAFEVPVGFTIEEYRESLASAIPETINAQLIKESEGVYTLKPVYFEKG
ncbi:MAG TPA: hypothetical protein PLU81_15145 [Deltaproteobacteria bacterium]|nr:hypothetical protein [Deltaproteobacteria bacterium]